MAGPEVGAATGQSGEDAELRQLGEAHVLHSLRKDRQIIFTRASGSRMWDAAGREYLDSVSGTNGPAAIGHSHPKVAEALAAQAGTLVSNFLNHDSDTVIRYCARLAGLTPGDLDRIYLTPGGGEAVEAAIKLAAFVTGRSEVISLHGAYHGLSLGTMSLGGLPSLRDWFPGGLRWPGFQQVPLPDPYRDPLGAGPGNMRPYLAALEQAMDRGTSNGVAAVIFELVQGPGGHVELPREYTAEVARICRERGVLLIIDEVQTGMGRCGRFWATERHELQPDMITFGKAFGGGFPFGGLIVDKRLVSEELERSPWNVLTFMNQPLQAAAGMAVLDVVEEEGLVERASILGQAALERFEQIAERSPIVGDVRGAGLMLALELVSDRETREPATEACARAWEFAVDIGLLTWFGGPASNVLKFKPPLSTPEAEFEEMLDRVERVVAYAQEQLAG